MDGKDGGKNWRENGRENNSKALGPDVAIEGIWF